MPFDKGKDLFSKNAEISMTLHVDSSTIRNQTALANVLDPVDDPTTGRNGAGQTATSTSTDSAAISASGQRLAAIGAHGDELSAIDDAETLVRSISASLRSSNSSSTAALHGSIDRSRAAALLVD
jgi:hypothetical protein